MDGKKSVKELISILHQCEIFQIGNFKLKSGTYSPVYIDLRRTIEHPTVIKCLAEAIRAKQMEENLNVDTVCGVPYTALPIASVFSVLYNTPMVMKRKEVKTHGTKKLIERSSSTNESCLIIEDIISSGASVIETAVALRNEGYKVEDCIVIVNRNQGGVGNLKRIGMNVHALFDMDLIFSTYCSINRIEAELIEQVKTYFSNNTYIPVLKPEVKSMSYSQRARNSTHPVAKRLFELMEGKRTNLCVAVDTNSSSELLKLADQLGPHICLLKTHIDILNDFTEELISKLTDLSITHNFLILEDRKFADIGSTVIQQYVNGIYKIQTWAHLVTVHSIPGGGIIEALKSAKTENRACILIAEMSSKGALTNDEYKENVFKMAESHPDFVIGYIGQQIHPKSKNLIHMCPGVNLTSTSDSFGQQYRSPEAAVSSGADIVIVGRGIFKASDVIASAIEYKRRAFDAYLHSISEN